MSERSTSELSAIRPAAACARTCSLHALARSRRAARPPATRTSARAAAAWAPPSEASCSTSRSTRSGSGRSWTRYRHGHRALREQARDRLVGGDHQVLDQAVGLGLRARRGSPRRCRARRTTNSGSSESITSAPLLLARALRAPRPRSRAARSGSAHGSARRSRPAKIAIDALVVQAHVRADQRAVEGRAARPPRRAARARPSPPGARARARSEQASLESACGSIGSTAPGTYTLVARLRASRSTQRALAARGR